MSRHQCSLLHYEHIPGRDNGRREWRVADDNDDVVTDFATEAEAAAFVREHNAAVRRPASWRY